MHWESCLQRRGSFACFTRCRFVGWKYPASNFWAKAIRHRPENRWSIWSWVLQDINLGWNFVQSLVSNCVLLAAKYQDSRRQPSNILRDLARRRGCPIREIHLLGHIPPRCQTARRSAQVWEDFKYHQAVQALLHQDQLQVWVYGRQEPEVLCLRRGIHYIDLYHDCGERLDCRARGHLDEHQGDQGLLRDSRQELIQCRLVSCSMLLNILSRQLESVVCSCLEHPFSCEVIQIYSFYWIQLSSIINLFSSWILFLNLIIYALTISSAVLNLNLSFSSLITSSWGQVSLWW